MMFTFSPSTSFPICTLSRFQPKISPGTGPSWAGFTATRAKSSRRSAAKNVPGSSSIRTTVSGRLSAVTWALNSAKQVRAKFSSGRTWWLVISSRGETRKPVPCGSSRPSRRRVIRATVAPALTPRGRKLQAWSSLDRSMIRSLASGRSMASRWMSATTAEGDRPPRSRIRSARTASASGESGNRTPAASRPRPARVPRPSPRNAARPRWRPAGAAPCATGPSPTCSTVLFWFALGPLSQYAPDQGGPQQRSPRTADAGRGLRSVGELRAL